MSWAYIGAAAVTVIGGALTPQKGGVGGATSAQVQGGQTGLQYQDVEGTDIMPFEYTEYQEQLAEEEEQRQIAEAMALAQQQGLWSGGLISLMQGGPLYANEGSPLSSEAEEWKRFQENRLEGEVVFSGGEIEIPNLIEEVVVKAEQPTPIGEPGDNLEEILVRQARRDMLLEAGLGVLTNLINSRNKKSTVSPRRSVTPLPGGAGGRAARQERQREGTLGITPFTYQGGGEVLGRSMFAQNYMPQGGAMQGPGGPKSDLIPVMASDGEYMLSKAAVDQAGGGNHAEGIARLEQFNQLGNRRYG